MFLELLLTSDKLVPRRLQDWLGRTQLSEGCHILLSPQMAGTR